MTARARIEAALREHGSKGSNGSWTCPAHDDRSPSLSLDTGDDGRVLICCHAGCDVGRVLGALGLAASDLFEEPASSGSALVAEYEYVDETGEVLFVVERRSPKTFRQRRPDPDRPGEWLWNLGETRRVLYRLPYVAAAITDRRTVYVVEGEKDVEAIVRAGGEATCNPGGAGKWREEYAASLRGAHVVVVADRDEPGRAHAATVAASLGGVAASVELVEPGEGKDATDHLAAGRALDDFRRAVQRVAKAEATEQFIDWATFWERDTSEAEWLVEDIIAVRRAHTIWAARKAGKSLLMLWLALEMIRSGAVVLYLDWEMTEDDVHDRLADMGCGPETDLSLLRYALLPSLPPLNTASGGMALLAIVDAEQAKHPDRPVVVVIDTFSRAVDGEENSNDVPQAFYQHTGIGLKRRRVTYVRLDHAGHEAAHERGGSAKGDDVDVSWKLVQGDDGLVLHRHLSRMPWVPPKVALTILDGPLRFDRTAQPWPAGTMDCAADLDALAVPLELGVRAAQKRLRSAGLSRRMAVIASAMKYRRSVSQLAGSNESENGGKLAGNDA